MIKKIKSKILKQNINILDNEKEEKYTIEKRRKREY